MNAANRNITTVLVTEKCNLTVGNVYNGQRIGVILIVLGQYMCVAFSLIDDLIRRYVRGDFFCFEYPNGFAIDKQEIVRLLASLKNPFFNAERLGEYSSLDTTFQPESSNIWSIKTRAFSSGVMLRIMMYYRMLATYKFSIFFDYSYFSFSTNLVSSKFASIAPDLSSSHFCCNCSFVGATFPLQDAPCGCPTG